MRELFEYGFTTHWYTSVILSYDYTISFSYGQRQQKIFILFLTLKCEAIRENIIIKFISH